MASLLERMNVPSAGTGPVRSSKSGGSRSSTPYARAPRGDVESAWSHDLYAQHNTLSARMNLPPSKPTLPPAVAGGSNVMAQKAFREILGGGQLSIKGASTSANVIEVSGLADGTTAEDVSAIFKKCGQISSSKLISKRNEDVCIRVTFKNASSAQEAVKSFNGVPADGKTLSVRAVGATSAGTALAGRFGKDGLGLVRQEGSVDVLMDSESTSSKMRSDSLTSDPRAQVLVAPPGTDPKDYIQAPARTRGGRGRGRGNRRGGGGGRAREMDRMDMN
ncbi:hypothetical protein D9757_006444 [Collybiopsis confluens]|uniref:RRM domain-containing protein n=1 Tax=Collybiopsis confluens TaxID=2823264 RepID=A0A8H5M8H3_9AGAR|nr:hypothetical protein D9757_006444 [Collybiopsis confluens]